MAANTEANVTQHLLTGKTGITDGNKDSSPVLRQVVATSGAMLLSVATGCATGYSAILLPQLRDTMSVSTEALSWIASITCLPIFLGSLIAGWLMESYGRRLSLIIPTFPFVMGWVIISFSNSVWPILLGRFLTGLCQGALAPACSVFIGEISTPNYRGVLLTAVSLSTTIGILFAHVVGTFIHWKLTSIICGMFPVVAYIIVLFLPESPSWLVSRGEIEKCRRSFAWYRGTGEAAIEEMTAMIAQKSREQHQKNSMLELFKANYKKPEFRKPIVIMTISFLVSQMTGATFICYYTTLVMEPLTGGKIDFYTAMIIIDVSRCLALSIACVLLRRVGRRPLAIYTSVLTSLTLIILAGYIFCVRHETIGKSSILSVALVCLYMLASHIGIVTLPWTMIGEVFPTSIRGLSSGICVMVSSVAGFITVKTVLQMFEAFGMDGTFLFYGICTLLGAIYFYFKLPETKGKTLLEVEESFK